LQKGRGLDGERGVLGGKRGGIRGTVFWIHGQGGEECREACSELVERKKTFRGGGQGKKGMLLWRERGRETNLTKEEKKKRRPHFCCESEKSPRAGGREGHHREKRRKDPRETGSAITDTFKKMKGPGTTGEKRSSETGRNRFGKRQGPVPVLDGRKIGRRGKVGRGEGEGFSGKGKGTRRAGVNVTSRRIFTTLLPQRRGKRTPPQREM